MNHVEPLPVSGLCVIPDTSAIPIWVTGSTRLKRSGVQQPCQDYELHEPPVPTSRLIARAMGAPLAQLYREDDKVAEPMLALHGLGIGERNRRAPRPLLQGHLLSASLGRCSALIVHSLLH